MIRRSLAALFVLGATLAGGPAALALGDSDYVGSLELVGFNFCPQGTVAPRGQELRVADYQLLYAVIGNRYGGDAGKGTFKLPNLAEITANGLQDKAPLAGLRYCMVIDGQYPPHP